MPVGPTGWKPVLRAESTFIGSRDEKLAELREDLVRFLQRLLAADVEPGAFDLEGLYRFALVKPLNETARLVWIIAGGDVGRKERHHCPCKIIKRYPGDRVFRF